MPAVDRFGTDTLVEVDRGLVPVQHTPFDTAAVLGQRPLREMAHQRQADAAAAVRGIDKQIFQKDIRPRLECVERIVE